APAPTGPASNARAQLIEAANKEGEVAVWANTFDKAEVVLKPFKEKYPNIRVKIWDAATGDDAINKITEESKAGRISGDIFFGGEGDLVRAMVAGVLQENDWKTAGWPNQPAHKFYINYGANPRLPAFNTNVIPIDQGPKSWEDMATDKWRTKAPVSSFSGAEVSLLLGYMWGESPNTINWAKSEKYLTDVVTNNKPKVVRGFSGPIELLVSGEYGIFLPVASGRTILEYAIIGAPIALVPVGKTPGNTQAVGMWKNPAHPNAAKVFADWFTSEGGQLSKIQADLVFAYDPEIAKVARANQLLAGKYKTEVVPVPSAMLTPANVKKANDFWLKLLGVT
ncbi:MAG: hypothetical protein HW414_969, partial [Dehalococcoidia bacterium]|nr:hypothetical protein [Dehalococcoidia bacterium]